MKLFQVDAFASKPFEGNPAAVCLLDGPRPDEWMQHVAAEMNLSETAFPLAEGDGFRLRWFTPTAEVRLCGHATLATSHVLWSEGFLPEDRPARYETLSGRLTATRKGEFIELDFPARPVQPTEPPAGLAEALGVTPRFVGCDVEDVLVLVDDEVQVRGLSPNIPGLACLGARGVMVTAPSARSEYDFVSRFFAPGVGIDEDPVTGSAHCCLAPFWAGRLGRDELVGYQASERGGVVRVRLEGDRVKLAGRAVTVLRGELSTESLRWGSDSPRKGFRSSRA